MKFTLATIATRLTIHAADAIGIDEQSALLPLAVRGLESKSSPSDGSGESDVCAEPRDLDEFPQWREEVGYWIGDLSFYGPIGTPFKSASWNYPYDNYKGFITGNVSGGSYRQRNVFLYPPQTEDACLANDGVTGNGTCGTNGNTKLFEADQTGSSCDGSIEGPFAGVFDTKTTLIGNGDAVLYQVHYQGALFQNQVTTLSGDGRRTRSAHQFNPFGPAPSVPDSCSFYRERRVNATEFYDALEATISEYGVLDEDVCTRDMQGTLVEGVVGGMGACRAFLEESFNLDAEEVSAGDVVGDGPTAEAEEQTHSSMPAPDLDNNPAGEGLETEAEEEKEEDKDDEDENNEGEGNKDDEEEELQSGKGHRLPSVSIGLLTGGIVYAFIGLIL